jgi:hypothetical protein
MLLICSPFALLHGSHGEGDARKRKIAISDARYRHCRWLSPASCATVVHAMQIGISGSSL